MCAQQSKSTCIYVVYLLLLLPLLLLSFSLVRSFVHLLLVWKISYFKRQDLFNVIFAYLLQLYAIYLLFASFRIAFQKLWRGHNEQQQQLAENIILRSAKVTMLCTYFAAIPRGIENAPPAERKYNGRVTKSQLSNKTHNTHIITRKQLYTCSDQVLFFI